MIFIIPLFAILCYNNFTICLKLHPGRDTGAGPDMPQGMVRSPVFPCRGLTRRVNPMKLVSVETPEKSVCK